MIILYIDDYILLSRTKKEADKVFDGLDKKGYTMIDEGNIEDYLCIIITHGNAISFKISQPYLIYRIVASIPGMTDARSA